MSDIQFAFLIGLQVVVALSLFIAGIAVGAWLQTNYQRRLAFPVKPTSRGEWSIWKKQGKSP
jgi:hypothetical protein